MLSVEIATEQNGEFVLNAPELGRKSEAGHDAVTESDGYPRADAQVAMNVSVENGVIAHACAALSRTACGAIELSKARLGGRTESRLRVRSRTCPNRLRIASVARGIRAGSCPPIP